MTNELNPYEGAATLDALLATTPTRTLHGEQAAASGRAALEAAGVDTSALEERVARGGRPPLGETVIPGERSPRVNVAIPATVDELLNQRTATTGRSRSEVVRDALAAYLTPS
jgi:hypothetical protein